MKANNLERRHQLRQQLLAFYGDPLAAKTEPVALEGKETKSSNADVSTATNEIPPELDMGSESFSVEKYTSELFRAKSLKGVVETDTWLVRTASRLEMELRELVYRNYSKFISATDTIQKMREDVSGMDEKLRALSGNVGNINHVSKDVSVKLQEHRSRIEKVITRHRMIRKVQFLVGLANTMRMHMERQEYSECVRAWVMGDSFIGKHVKLPSIAGVHEECKELAMRLYGLLQEEVLCVSMENPDASNVIRRVVEEMRLMRTTTLFGGDDRVTTVAGVVSDEGVLLPFVEEIVSRLKRNVKECFDADIRCFKAALMVALQIPCLAGRCHKEKVEKLAHVSLLEPLAQLKSSCALFHSSNEQLCNLFSEKGDTSQLALAAESINTVLVDSIAAVTVPLGDLLIAIVDSIANDCSSLLSSSAAIQTDFAAVFSAFTKHLVHYSTTLKGLGASYLSITVNQEGEEYAAQVDQSVLDVLLRLTNHLEAKVVDMNHTREQACSADDTCGRQKPLEEVFGTCFSSFVFASAASAADSKCVAVFLESDTVKHGELVNMRKRHAYLTRALVRRGIVLSGQFLLNQAIPAFSSSNAVDPSASTAAEHGGVAFCLRNVVHNLGELYGFLKRGVLLHATDDGSSSASLVAGKYRSDGSPSGGTGGGGQLAFAAAGSGRNGGNKRAPLLAVCFVRKKEEVLQASVERIFSKHSQDGAALQTMPRELRAASVVAAVAVYLVKGIVEYVRQESFTRCGFQCVQTGCTFLLHAFTPTAAALSSPKRANEGSRLIPPLEEWLDDCGEDRLLKGLPLLLNECCTCAYERCGEKVPLTAVVVDRLVNSVLEEMGDASLSAGTL